MYCIEIPNKLNDLMSLFYKLGLWHRADTATVRETGIKLFCSFYFLLYPTSFLIGAIKSDNSGDAVLLAQVTLSGSILNIKFLYLIWRTDQILEMLHGIGVYSMKSREEFNVANDKLKIFMKFVVILLGMSSITCYTATLAPIFVKERKLFLNIAFPFDYKNNEIAFWLATFFILSEMSLIIIAIMFSILIWYLMLSCASRYEILQNQIRNIGVMSTTTETTNQKSDVEKQNSFHRDLIAAIDSHQHIKNLTHQMKSFAANIFFTQIITGGLCICGSTYCLAFVNLNFYNYSDIALLAESSTLNDVKIENEMTVCLNISGNLLGPFIYFASLLYNVAEIFMIMYLGNEIKLSSDRLSYCLFESNWFDQCKKTKQLAITFGELLKQPHEIVVGVILYPLTLETFTRILNFAYSTFNILKRFK